MVRVASRQIVGPEHHGLWRGESVAAAGGTDAGSFRRDACTVTLSVGLWHMVGNSRRQAVADLFCP